MFLDKDQAINLMEKAIGELGADYVYKPRMTPNPVCPEREQEVCDYFRNGQPSCIVGHVFSYLGYGPTEEIEGKAAGSAIEALEIDADDAAIAILENAQCSQDAGTPWGEALEKAIDEYNHRAEPLVFVE